MGGPRSLPFFFWLRLRPSGNYASWENPCTVETAVRRIVQTSEEGHPCCQYCHSAVAYSLQLHNSPLYSKINVPAALGAGGPRWQPLNVALPCLIGETPVDHSGRRQQWRRQTVATRWQRCSFFLGTRSSAEGPVCSEAVSVFDSNRF